MWTLRLNSTEIPLPAKDDVFFCSIQNNSELISTDFDIYYDYNVQQAFGLNGVLEAYSNNLNTPKRYESKEYRGLLTNPLISNATYNCTITINSVSLTKRRMNITIKADTSILSEKYNEEYYRYRRLTKPNITDHELYPVYAEAFQFIHPHYPWSGYRITDTIGDISANTILARGNIPYIYGVEYLDTITNLGIDLVNTPAYGPYIVPNTLFADGDIKMRRARVNITTCRDIISSGLVITTGRSAAVKGEYAGLYDDTLRAVYSRVSTDGTLDNGETRLSIINSFRMEAACQKHRTYYRFNHSTTVSDIFLASTEPFTAHIRPRGNLEWTAQGNYNPSTKLYETNPSTAGFEDWQNYDPKDSYIEFIPDNGTSFSEGAGFAIRLMFQFNSNTPNATIDDLCFDMQQHWLDNYEGIKKVEGNDGDTTIEWSHDPNPSYDPNHPTTIVEFNTKHFDSRGWGCNVVSDYNGTIATGYTTDTGYNEPLYNVASGHFCPLMYTDRQICLNATIYDILWNFSMINECIFNVDPTLRRVSFSTDIEPLKIDDYIIDESLSFTSESMWWTNASGKKYILYGDGEDGVELYKSGCYSLQFYQTGVMLWDANGGVGSGDTIGRVALPLNESGELDKDVTVLHSARRILSGASTQNPMNRYMYAMQFGGRGFFMFMNPPTYPSGTNFKITTLKNPPTMTVKIPQLLNSFYVTFQNRTFFVKSQEVGDDGINEVELILYC